MSARRPKRRWPPWEKRPARSLEESCRKVHAFATRHPELYALRVRAECTLIVLQPVLTLIFLCAVLAGFPWAFRGSELLRPIYQEPVWRWAVLAGIYTVWIPLVGSYFAGVVRGLTLRLPGAEGKLIEESEAPRLVRLLEDTCRSLDAPGVDEVRISTEDVLEIQRRPMEGLGALGRARTVLVAGLPLLEEISPQQLRALVAHEVAHLATHKRRLGGHVLGLRARLAAMREAVEQSAVGRDYWRRVPDEMLLGIIDKLQARLLPATFPAARQHEAEADAIAATIAGRDFAVSALLRERIAGHALARQFQERCMQLAETSAEPPEDLFEQRARAAGGGFTEGEIHAWLRTELEMKDDLAQSHGPLWDRLRMLGCRLESLTDFHDLMGQLRPQEELGETAARFFLGDTAETLRAGFYREWVEKQSADWRKRFEVYEKLRATAAEWYSGQRAEEETAESLWQIAVAVGNTQSWRAALPVAKRILERRPEHADANLLSGQVLLEDGDAAGIEFLERAMRSEARTVPIACTLAARFLEERGQREGAGEFQKRCEEHQKKEKAMAEARAQVSSTDVFLTADCPRATVEALRGAVERNRTHIRTAYLLRKQVAAGDAKPLYVLGIERRSLFFENAGLANRVLLERIMGVAGIPGDVLVCVVTRANRAMLTRWMSVPGSLLFPVGPRTAADAAGLAMGQKTAAHPESLVREAAKAPRLPASSSPATAK